MLAILGCDTRDCVRHSRVVVVLVANVVVEPALRCFVQLAGQAARYVCVVDGYC